jgi:hypothetical protein
MAKTQGRQARQQGTGVYFPIVVKLPEKGEVSGLRGGFGFGVPKLDQGIREILEAPTAPFPANLPGKAAGTIDCYLKSL